MNGFYLDKETREELLKTENAKKKAKNEYRNLRKLYFTQNISGSELFYLEQIEKAKKTFLNLRDECKKLTELLKREYLSSGEEDSLLTKEERETNEKVYKTIKNAITISGTIISSITEPILPTLEYIIKSKAVTTYIFAQTGVDLQMIKSVANILSTSVDIIKILGKISEDYPNLDSQNKFFVVGKVVIDIIKAALKNKGITSVEAKEEFIVAAGKSLDEAFKKNKKKGSDKDCIIY